MMTSDRQRTDDARRAAIVQKAAEYHTVALALQGGGALGAYQAGVIEALEETGLRPNQVVGVSIGAINAALYAGNAPEKRLGRIRAFWEHVTSSSALAQPPVGTAGRRFFNLASAAGVMSSGAPGFFTPRPFNPWLVPTGWQGSTSFYDTSPLLSTLNELIDWDQLNSGAVRIAVGAVNLTSGNFRYFDSTKERIGPQHILASGALPPGFPAVEIDGEEYWDGGLVSNTPLQYLLEYETTQDALVFQVDLFSARGAAPQDMPGVLSRQKEILYSSRTRNNTDAFRKTHAANARLRDALKRLPPDALREDERAFLAACDETQQVNILHLIYQRRSYEEQSQDYEFSRASMLDHWAAGRRDLAATLEKPERLDKPHEEDGVSVFDVHDPRHSGEGLLQPGDN